MDQFQKGSYNFEAGEVLLFNKPYQWTSFDVVNKARYLIKQHLNIKKIKVGHAGTLDPLATGLLIICTGKFTKRINEFQEKEKEYTGSFYLGATRPSFDKETEIDKNYPTDHISKELIYEEAKNFIGDFDQTPPLFSAKKIKGERAYNLARNNEDVKLSPKHIKIYNFEITKIDLPFVHFMISCSKGTYIRAIARDFGEKLNCGAYLDSLERTRIGDFNVDEALSIEEFEKHIQNYST